MPCRLQEMDSRNFHAWAYRRWITAKAGTSPEREAQYTMDLINTNFSDYSAWHARTVLLPQLHGVMPATLQKPVPTEDSPSNADSSQTASIEASGLPLPGMLLHADCAWLAPEGWLMYFRLKNWSRRKYSM